MHRRRRGTGTTLIRTHTRSTWFISKESRLIWHIDAFKAVLVIDKELMIRIKHLLTITYSYLLNFEEFLLNHHSNILFSQKFAGDNTDWEEGAIASCPYCSYGPAVPPRKKCASAIVVRGYIVIENCEIGFCAVIHLCILIKGACQKEWTCRVYLLSSNISIQ